MARFGLKIGQLVHVEWIDSATPSEQRWMQPDELTDIISIWGCETVGWVQDLCKDWVALVQTRDTETGNINGAIAIPRVAIVAVHQLGG